MRSSPSIQIVASRAFFLARSLSSSSVSSDAASPRRYAWCASSLKMSQCGLRPFAATQFPADTLEPRRVRLEVLDLDGLVGLALVPDHFDRLSGLHDPGRLPVDGVGLLLRQPMPVGDHHFTPAQLFHAMRRHKLTRAVEAQIAEGRVQLLKALADRHVRADNQDGVGEAVYREATQCD